MVFLPSQWAASTLCIYAVTVTINIPNRNNDKGYATIISGNVSKTALIKCKFLILDKCTQVIFKRKGKIFGNKGFWFLFVAHVLETCHLWTGFWVNTGKSLWNDHKRDCIYSLHLLINICPFHDDILKLLVYFPYF